LHLPLADLSSRENLRRAYLNVMTVAGDKAHDWPAKGNYIEPGRARTSALVWQLFGHDTSKPWDKQPGLTKAPDIVQMPLHTSNLLHDHELRMVVQWIDMGAQFEPPAAANGIDPPSTQ
jgi:hypothetical protein